MVQKKADYHFCQAEGNIKASLVTFETKIACKSALFLIYSFSELLFIVENNLLMCSLFQLDSYFYSNNYCKY